MSEDGSLVEIADEAAAKYLRERGDPRTPLLAEQILNAIQKAVVWYAERCKSPPIHITGDDAVVAVQAVDKRIADLEGQLEKAQVDAERYRYFKDNGLDFDLEATSGGYQWKLWSEDGTSYRHFHRLDDAIDAAREAGSED